MPIAYDVVRILGAVYLLYLAWQAFRSETLLGPTPAERVQRSTLTVFGQGLLTNLLNPKMALFVLALFPQFIRADAGSVVLQMLLLATVLNAIGVVVNGLVILTASQVGGSLLGRGSFGRWPQVLLGTVFGGLALRLAFDSRR